MGGGTWLRNICCTDGSFQREASQRQELLLTEGHFCSLEEAAFTRRLMSFLKLEGVEVLLVAVYEQRRCRPNIALMGKKNTAIRQRLSQVSQFPRLLLLFKGFKFKCNSKETEFPGSASLPTAWTPANPTIACPGCSGSWSAAWGRTAASHRRTGGRDRARSPPGRSRRTRESRCRRPLQESKHSHMVCEYLLVHGGNMKEMRF